MTEAQGTELIEYAAAIELILRALLGMIFMGAGYVTYRGLMFGKRAGI